MDLHSNNVNDGNNAVVDRRKRASVDVIIPTYRPDAKFREILKRLQEQTVPPEHIIVYNTEEAFWDREAETIVPSLRVTHISKADFDHGGTRHAAACDSEADIIIFMTQDALPADGRLIEKLTEPLLSGRAKICYARQLPNEGAGLIERTAREFNYPGRSRLKSAKDIEELGIKTIFCSDVCAAYDRKTYLALGGFPRPVIFNEDMIFAGKAIDAGETICYAADARVYHSHDLKAGQQFRRNFDLGVSQADHAELFDRFPAVGEGKKLIRTTADVIKKEHKYHLLFTLFASGAAKYAGYWFGRHYKKLPGSMIKRFSSDPGYWERKDRSNV